MLARRNEPGRHIGAGGHISRLGRFSTRNHPVAVLVSYHELLLERAILRYHRQTLPHILYTDGAWVQRVYRTQNEPISMQLRVMTYSGEKNFTKWERSRL